MKPAAAGFFFLERPMSDIQRLGVTQRYADAVMHNGTLYLVEVPQTEHADIGTQTAEVLARIDHMLECAGSDRSRLLAVTIHLADMADYAAMNAVWDAWIPAGAAPVRCCVRAGLAHPGWRVEMSVTAACGH